MDTRHIPFGEKLATLVVDGVEQEINGKIEGENAVLVLTDAFAESPAEFTGRGREPYRAGLVVRDGAICEEQSVRPVFVGGEVTDKGMDGVTVESRTASFSHMMVINSDYTVKNSRFIADTDSDGKKVCDFNGLGSMICAFKDSKLKIEDSYLFTRGVAKPVLYIDSGADCLLKNSTYKCMGGTLYAGYRNTAGFIKMVAPPWVLGLPGSARGSNLMGTLSTFTISNCDCYANDWGVISTDGGEELALFVVDSKITLIGEGNMIDNPFVRRYGPGYGVYCCCCDEFFHGAEFYVGTYAIVGIGGTITLASSNGTIVPKKKYRVPTGRMAPGWDGRMEPEYDVFWYDEPIFEPIEGKGKPTRIESDGWGFMFHYPTNINVLDGTICNTDYATFLIRSTSSDIVVDNSYLNPKDGVILQMIDNDDKAVGGAFKPDIYDENGVLIQPHDGPVFNHEFFEHPGFPGLDYECVPQAGSDKVTAKFTNCTLTGSIYNATGYRNVGDGSRGQGEPLTVTLGEGASLTGSITSTTSKHVDEFGRPNNLFTQEQYYYLGHVTNVPYANGVNDVHVVLEGNAVWTAEGENLLASLTIGEHAVLAAPEGKALTLTVDGEPAALEAGKHYEGKLVLTAK